jgi:hypothetical protein
MMNLNDLDIFPKKSKLATKILKNHYMFAILKKSIWQKLVPKKSLDKLCPYLFP